MTTPGEPPAAQLAAVLADLLGDDGSHWTYSAEAGGYVCDDYAEPCRDAAAVAYTTGGEDGVVRQAPPKGSST